MIPQLWGNVRNQWWCDALITVGEKVFKILISIINGERFISVHAVTVKIVTRAGIPQEH